MKAIVFGGSGFVGSYVVDALAQAGHEVTVFDRSRLAHTDGRQRFVQGDILDEEAVRRAMTGQEVVYHFAGLANLEEAQSRPVDTARVNVLGNAILLEEARLAKVHRYVFASSIYVSGQAGGFYRASKQACESYVEEYQRWFGLDYTILRYGSIYGRGADGGNGVRHYLTQALEKRRIVVHGSGDELREYIHVSDVARSSVQILDPGFKNERVILTGHHPTRVRDLMEMIREILGLPIEIEYQPVDPLQSESGRTPHYRVTPYAFRPQMARKLISHHYVDLGTGLLDCLQEIQADKKPSEVASGG
ncbi:MAG: NAD(P)-dependent oxidoreductase [Candidatus Omnitrophica bacterium]|nr:NAD(P)-dependent oxidoreductase [Candidatus Omnitrophota bacterium]